QTAPVVMLLRSITWSMLTPLPHDFAIPIHFADRFVREDCQYTGDCSRLAAGLRGELHHHVPTLAAGESRVKHSAREAGIILAMQYFWKSIIPGGASTQPMGFIS